MPNSEAWKTRWSRRPTLSGQKKYKKVPIYFILVEKITNKSRNTIFTNPQIQDYQYVVDIQGPNTVVNYHIPCHSWEQNLQKRIVCNIVFSLHFGARPGNSQLSTWLTAGLCRLGHSPRFSKFLGIADFKKKKLSCLDM